ncbi:major facilitator superfamily domain-containing protein [Radiomyces spectabilis]|uniref:major facilitator superfamily domain-containing protein n=1 Tax=Radiomyces spectabilis TaxID=64574 RepID=UPI00221E5051|nr:major facilitator superfamily domain-containing protein [Radiomyces spectabilis]KAI8381140.1 major facilitator superfamily domain-containing protein [Radiomyces spectabilis]
MALTKSSSSTIDEPYSVFSKRKIRWIVIVASISAFFAPFSVNSYFPAMNKIEQDLHVTSQQINLSVTMFMIFQALSPSFWSSLADSRGRRPVYLITLLIYILSCAGLACVSNYTLLLVFRALQAFGASSVIAIGAGTIADITHPSERGGYIGWYSLGWNIGPVVGPAIGAVLSQYLGWRWIFWSLAIVCGVHWCIIGLFLPETLRSLVGNGSGYANPTPFQWYRNYKSQRQHDAVTITQEKPSTTTHVSRKKSFIQKLMTPLQPLLYVKEKDTAILIAYYSVQYAACYCVTTSIPYLFIDIYNLNTLMIGLSYLANGFGCIVGSVIQGKILNRDYRRAQKKCAEIGSTDIPLEHARLRTVWFHAILFKILLVAYGWCLHIKAHLAIALVIHFFLGFTSQAIFNCIQTLLVDLFPNASASVTACNNIFRCLCGAVATTLVLPGVKLLGAGWMFTLVSGILLLSRIPMFWELSRGPRWRHQREQRQLHV